MEGPVFLTGRVTRLGYYYDTLPKLVILIAKKDAITLPWQDGERVPLTLEVLGGLYQAGIRTTAKATTVTICPDLLKDSGQTLRLADLLLAFGLSQRMRVTLARTENGVRLVKENEPYV